jgi:hypothetical protein
MMGEEFYAILKMVSGEEVFSLVSIDNTTEISVIILQNPVVLKYIPKSKGTLLKLEPWIKFSTDDFFIVNIEKIITMTEIKDKNMIKFYQEYLEEYSTKKPFPNLNDISEEVKVSDKMGYISSVEEARKKLEDIYNNNNIKDN